ncbi:hypothetical protein AB9N12_05595 [Bacteroides sp. AN502(2024)]|uniref:hypothetical protein n=1 Tax=Bacteroides sp. AN502(2024) TaxID=3160599 RepID=UPI00351485D4
MNKKKRKNSFYTAVTIILLSITFVIYSCSSNEYEYTNESNKLIDSIAQSDEFWEFERNSKLLSDKFQAYTSTLSEEEYNKLMVKLNDDDYIEEFIKKSNLEQELHLMNEAKENLLLYTGFARLSEDERIALFRQYAESHESTGKTRIKTRTEGGDANSCEAKRQAAYAQAKANYDNDIINCRKESSTNSCYAQALSRYERNQRAAEREYKSCIQGN